MKPLIGITPTPQDVTFDHGAFHRYCLSNTYTQSVIAAGGIPVILPADVNDVEPVLDRLDGVIFSGGGDIDPTRFGEERHPATDGIDAERDDVELAAVREAVERDIPILGICRGIQSINVALGGTLIQDIETEVAGALQHRQHQAGKFRDDVSHTVTLTPGDHLLRRIHGADQMTTNSFHHQAVKDLAAGLEAIATTEDGIIEALWHPGMHFGLAVQWHPEMLAATHNDQAAIFSAFVDAAARVGART